MYRCLWCFWTAMANFLSLINVGISMPETPRRTLVQRLTDTITTTYTILTPWPDLYKWCVVVLTAEWNFHQDVIHQRSLTFLTQAFQFRFMIYSRPLRKARVCTKGTSNPNLPGAFGACQPLSDISSGQSLRPNLLEQAHLIFTRFELLFYAP